MKTKCKSYTEECYQHPNCMAELDEEGTDLHIAVWLMWAILLLEFLVVGGVVYWIVS